MGRIAKWFFMLSKRLYKKPSFLILLLLIPICVGLFAVAARQDSGFVHIVLAQERSGDTLSSEIIRDLMAEDGMLRFTLAESPDDALEAVVTGEADEAWIFPGDTEDRVRDFISGKNDYIVRSVIREDTALLQLAREKLSSALYQYCAKAHYIDYIRKHFAELDVAADGELAAYFEQVKVSEDLFLYGDPAAPSLQDGALNYLTSPIRGLLAVMMLLCCMAATMFYMQDERAGTFCWVRQSRRGLTAFGCIATAGLHSSVIVLISLLAASLSWDLFAEITAILTYCLCCSGFCLLLKAILPSIGSYGAIVPLVTVAVVGICPVFLDLRELLPVQLLFPPTYYINGLYDRQYLLYALAYTILCLCLAWLISWVRGKLRRE